jgi:hypothetical protein
VICVGLGLALAFLPINERPFEYFLKNLYLHLIDANQFIYHKSNSPPPLLKGMYYEADPHIVLAHVDSKEKLELYVSTKNTPVVTEKKTPIPTKTQPPSLASHPPLPSQSSAIAHTAPLSQALQPTTPTTSSTSARPWVSGTVHNQRNIPLPGILVYIKDPTTSKTLRILKTNPHGVFASFHPLPFGDYLCEAIDTGKNYLFDPQTIRVTSNEHVFSITTKHSVI